MACVEFTISYIIPCIPFFLFLYYMYKKLFISSSLPVNFPVLHVLPFLLANAHRIHDWLIENLVSLDGDFFVRGPWLSGMKFFVTSDLANVQHVLTRNLQNYPKGDDFFEIFEPLGDVIFNIDGELWRHLRKRIHLAVLQTSFSTFVTETTRENIDTNLLPFLLKTVERGATIDLQDMFSRLSFDMTCILAFGTDTDSLSVDLPDVLFVRAMDDSLATIFSRIIRPWWKIFKFFNIGQEKRLAEARIVIDQFIAEAIGRRRQEIIEGKRVCPDLLSSYMKESDEPISNKFLRDSVLSILVAGRDTVTSSLTWFFWALYQNKHAEEKILQELSSLNHNITSNGITDFDPEELENSVYLKAAILETLRLYPSVPLNFKTVLKPDTLPSGFTVTPGTKVVLSAYAMGRMKNIWGHDCMEFKPERWISDKGTLRHEPSYKFLAFNTGPRSCLGKNMALSQMKMVAAEMVYNFCFEVVEGQAVQHALSIILNMKNGLKVRVRKRENSI